MEKELVPFKWETICITSTSETIRSKVIGGWIVNTVLNSGRGSACMTTTFIADPKWIWSVSDDK